MNKRTHSIEENKGLLESVGFNELNIRNQDYVIGIINTLKFAQSTEQATKKQYEQQKQLA